VCIRKTIMVGDKPDLKATYVDTGFFKDPDTWICALPSCTAKFRRVVTHCIAARCPTLLTTSRETTGRTCTCSASSRCAVTTPNLAHACAGELVNPAASSLAESISAFFLCKQVLTCDRMSVLPERAERLFLTYLRARGLRRRVVPVPPLPTIGILEATMFDALAESDDDGSSPAAKPVAPAAAGCGGGQRRQAPPSRPRRCRRRRSR
jgi:hypothetical protein